MPAYQAILSGEGAYDEISERLPNLGYSLLSEEDDQSQSEWRRPAGEDFATVSLVKVSAGDEIEIGNEIKPVENDGIRVSVSAP